MTEQSKSRDFQAVANDNFKVGCTAWRHAGEAKNRNVVIIAPAQVGLRQQRGGAGDGDFGLKDVMFVAAVGVFNSARNAENTDAIAQTRSVPWLWGLLAGAVIGVLSGLTGTGGAIFLTPLLLFARWMPTRQASGTSVAFVWINSLTALAGLLQSGQSLPQALPVWLAVVAMGALLGTQLGLKWLPVRALRYALGVVLLIAAGKLWLA